MFNLIKYMACALLLVSASVHASDVDLAAQKFWGEFRQAVIVSDYAKLAKMTKFPLSIHGEADFIPVQKIEKNELKDMMEKVIGQEQIVLINGKDETTTIRKIINETKELDKSHILVKGKYFRVSDLEFEYENGSWWLFRAYYTAE